MLIEFLGGGEGKEREREEGREREELSFWWVWSCKSVLHCRVAKGSRWNEICPHWCFRRLHILLRIKIKMFF